MPIIPTRGVSDVGIISDTRPFETPANSWSGGRNVRFRHRGVFRSSAFKNLKTPFVFASSPRLVLDAASLTSTGCLVVVKDTGEMTQINANVVSEVGPSPVLITSPAQLTHTKLGGVTYVTSRNDVPLYRVSPDAGVFQRIPAWGATDRCVALRSYKDFLVALNISKGTSHYPAMVKWSDATQAGAPPGNWDTALVSSLAGENVLNDATGPLVDGLELGDSMILYGSTETYRMDYLSGSELVFAFEKLFTDLGAISQNCVESIAGKHYVFAADDLVVHDGVTKISIADGRVRRRVFQSLDMADKDKCLTIHDSMNSEVWFCYPSAHGDCFWDRGTTSGCNEAAVYNYSNNTWSFIDLPGLVSAAAASLPSVTTWNDLGDWNTYSGSWASFTGQAPALPLVVTAALGAAPPNAYLMDDYQVGLLSNTEATDLITPAWVENLLKDSDDMGLPLNSRKLIRSIHPQLVSSSPDNPLTITVGASDFADQSTKWGSPRQFYPGVDYKKDFRVSGRYISIRFGLYAGGYSGLYGYDADVEVLAQR